MEPVPMMHHPKKGAVSGAVTLASRPEVEPPAPPPPQPPQMAPKVTRDCIDMMFTYMNYDLFIAKAFYFFFFSAFGSLFPLIAVYFKQLGLNATQSGLLIGLRPFVEFCSAPFWGNIADRFKKAKIILLFSVFCWILFTLSLAFVKPPAHSCIVKNATHTVLTPPRLKRSIGYLDDNMMETFENNYQDDDEYDKVPQRFRRQAPNEKTAGQSPYNLDHEDYDNRNEGETSGLVTPPFSSIVYASSAVQETFALLLLLVIIGEFFAAPAITLADAAVLGYLGSDCGNYGKQRMFGSLGWGLAMFFVGIALDHSTNFPGHPCPIQDPREKNYTICFAVFSVLMGFAWLAATQFHLQLDTDFIETIPLGELARSIRNRFMGIQQPTEQRNDFNKPQLDEKPAPPKKDTITLDKNDRLQISLDADADKDMVTDAMANKEEPLPHANTVPNWIDVIKLFANVHYGSFLFVSWFMGFGIGLVFTFLFWHLQDLGGSPTLFGIASVINHVSEIVAYFFSNKLITSLGHVRVLYIGLGGNVARFLYISWLRNPWWVLPFEFVQGLTHAAVWAACCSYITQATPPSKRSSAQGVLQGIHHGLGRGCGAIFGGIFVYSFGSELTFRGYGFFCMIIMAMYVGVNYFFGKPDIAADDVEGFIPPSVEESTALAPCGVPMNPLGSSLSNSRLADVDKGIAPAYGAINKSGDQHLAPGGAVNGSLPTGGIEPVQDNKNPFITNMASQQQQSSQRPYERSQNQQATRPYQQDPVSGGGYGDRGYGGAPTHDTGYQQGYPSGGGPGHRRQLSGGGEDRSVRQTGYGYGMDQSRDQTRDQGYGYGVNQPARQDSRDKPEMARPKRRDSGGRGYEQDYRDSFDQQPQIPGQGRQRRVSGGGSREEPDYGYDPRRSYDGGSTGGDSIDYPTRDEPDSGPYSRMRNEPQRTDYKDPRYTGRRDDAGYPGSRRDEAGDQRYPRREDSAERYGRDDDPSGGGGRYPPRRQDSGEQGRPRPQQRHDSGDYSMPLQTDPQTGRPIIPTGGFMRGGRGSMSSSGGY